MFVSEPAALIRSHVLFCFTGSSEREDNDYASRIFDDLHIADGGPNAVTFRRFYFDFISFAVMKNTVIFRNKEHLADNRFTSPEGVQFLIREFSDNKSHSE